jgi:hypothetical protein
MNSLNVEMSNEATNVTVGSDADAGNVFITSTGAGGSSGEITCSTIGAGFPEVSTAAGNSNACGAQVPDNTTGPAQIADIPQVEFNATATGNIYLVPGGPGESVDFSITNSGSSPAYVQGVTFAITGGLSTNCEASWFALVQPNTPVDATIAAGATVNYQPSGASISLINEPVNQDACQGDTPELTFTSN